jgi:hypothetical protein
LRSAELSAAHLIFVPVFDFVVAGFQTGAVSEVVEIKFHRKNKSKRRTKKAAKTDRLF